MNSVFALLTSFTFFLYPSWYTACRVLSTAKAQAKVTLALFELELAFQNSRQKFQRASTIVFHIFVIPVFNYLRLCCVFILALSIRDGGYYGQVAKKQC